ncbi:hypothetical protein [Nocardioides sp.]|uniref:hypothetical protein n=1 Tax=Nocardioides sp. TaxID=35761 RepID=UPI0031FF1633|nr:hypothetical protein [Nocardioides sp.]
MTTELEETLARELNEVADGVQVPPMPSVVPADEPQPRAARPWQPLLVAATVALIVGVVALLLSEQGDHEPQPTPSPTRVTDSPDPRDTTIPVTAPTVPYVFDQRLYVDGTQVPGAWWFVQSRAGVWLAQRSDGSWWWGGPGVDTGRIDAQMDQPPVMSPNGRYVAFVDLSSGRARLTGFDTQPAGEGFGQAPIDDLPSTEDGVPIRVRAVTDDGDVIVQGTRTSRMWRAQYQDQQTVVDLTETAPDQVVLQGTSAGLVVVDGADGAVDATSTEPYLATISADGELTREDALPTYDDLDISPGGTWLVRSPAGTLGGEVPSVATLSARPVGSNDEVVLQAPEGWGFANGTWRWEDDETLVSVLQPADGAEPTDAQLVRCSVAVGACRAFAGPSAGDPTGSYSAEETLDAVVEAVVAGNRAGLVDQAVIGDGEWNQLLGFAAGGGGSGSTCRHNGGGTRDCEIVFEADRATTYYAILEPAENAYAWRITYVGIGGA